MILHVHRDILTETWTLSTLTISYGEGAPLSFGFCVEDQDSGLASDDPVSVIKNQKQQHQTAIPTGRYRISTTFSPRFGRPVPELQDVPGYGGIRIHSGNSSDDSIGCLIPGLARDVEHGTVSRSRAACRWLEREIARVEALNGEVWIEITRGAA